MQLNIGVAGWRRSVRWKSGCRFVAIAQRLLPAGCGNRSGDDADRKQWQAIIAEGLGAQYGDAVPCHYCVMNWHSAWIKNVSASVSRRAG